MGRNTILIVGKEFIFRGNLLSGHLVDIIVWDDKEKHNFHVNRQSSGEYTAQWILKDGKLYLSTFSTYLDGKEVNLNYFFPDLFANPSPVMAYWINEHIRFFVWSYKNYINDIVTIEIKQGFISEIYHYRPCHHKYQTDRKITEGQLVELICTTLDMSLFEIKVSFYIARGLNEYDIVKKIIPVYMYNDELDSLTVRLLELMRRHSSYFHQLLCRYYPFTREMLKNYRSCLDWSALSGNVFLDWNEELLMEFKDKWNWESIIQSIIGIKGLENTDVIIKCYEMELIKAKDIEFTICRMIPYIPNNPIFDEFDVVIWSRNEELIKEKISKELKNAVMERIMKEDERLLLLAESQKPAEELEQIISFLERHSEILERTTYIHRQSKYKWKFDNSYYTDPFVTDNSSGNGFDYTFNTPAKRKILDDAVEKFLIEESIRIQIRKVWKLAR